jgi:bifunctional aspartokinase / homoserine dehydrogenase 1
MKVLKFGGSSVGSVKSFERVISIITEKKDDDGSLIVVVSALGGVTDQLLETGKLAVKRNEKYRNLLEQIEKRHIGLIEAIISVDKRSNVITALKMLFNELEDVLQGVSLTSELTRKTLDFVTGFGERFSAQILSEALNNRNIRACYTDARKLIKTDESFGEARVQTAQTYQNIRAYTEQNSGQVLVVTGFISSTEKNESSTLGRGGSDYTASLFGAAIKAEAIEIWTDVDGLMTADPRKVKRAFTVPNATYEEVMELSHFGAKVIYPPTIQPALNMGIPIFVKNTFRPDQMGTHVQKQIEKQPGLIRGLSSIDDVALITIRGSGMIGVSGVASRIFTALADQQINIILITQSSSEHTVTLAVLPEQASSAKKSIEKEFQAELNSEVVDEIIVERDLSIIAVVGENMRHTPGIAGRVFNALGRNGINITAIAQGSSERNISFVVNRKDERKAMNTLHDAFFLSGVKSVNLFLVGVGLIGSRLLEMLAEQAEVLFADYQIEVNLKGLANSRKMALSEESILLADWEQRLEDEGDPMELSAFVDRMIQLNLPNSIFIDCTASADIQQVYRDILARSISIVTPNKKANSSSQQLFDQLNELADLHNCAYRYETNVGAGLPLVTTMHEMVTTGDYVMKIEGVLSGTLSYLFNNFDGKIPFSELVKSAREKGYTEPDPREDLNGMDVGRKLLILARVAGYKLEFDDLEIQSLVPDPIRNTKTVDEFFEKLKKYDSHFEEMRKDAHEHEKKLCYIARFENGKPSVALESIGPDHPFYNLKGSDNIIALYSRYYRQSPLVIQGAGAGADVTAGGIISDILRVTNTKLFNNAGS